MICGVSEIKKSRKLTRRSVHQASACFCLKWTHMVTKRRSVLRAATDHVILGYGLHALSNNRAETGLSGGGGRLSAAAGSPFFFFVEKSGRPGCGDGIRRCGLCSHILCHQLQPISSPFRLKSNKSYRNPHKIHILILF